MAIKSWRCPNEDDPDPNKSAGIFHTAAIAVDVNGLSVNARFKLTRNATTSLPPWTANALKWKGATLPSPLLLAGINRRYIGVDQPGPTALSRIL